MTTYPDRSILWDFDGTLATRTGMWSGALIEALDVHVPGHEFTIEDVRPFLRDGFPWHRPEVAHPELSEPDAWWAHVGQVFITALDGIALAVEDPRAVITTARQRFVDPTAGWYLFDDTVAVLTRARERGWSNQVLSNHVPELGAIVEHLGLSPLLDAIHNSADTGYEKPNQRAFELALQHNGLDPERNASTREHNQFAEGQPRRPATVWMVGDNPVADADGASAVGIPAILIARNDTDAESRHRTAPNLSDAFQLIEAAASGESSAA